MKKERAIEELRGRESRKFILDTATNTLYIYNNPHPTELDTHENLTYDLELDILTVKGGYLMVAGNKFKFLVESTTINPAQDSDIYNFNGEVEIF